MGNVEDNGQGVTGEENLIRGCYNGFDPDRWGRTVVYDERWRAVGGIEVDPSKLTVPRGEVAIGLSPLLDGEGGAILDSKTMRDPEIVGAKR